jgi:Ni/Fe-hydrogenase subunit HybB-like protein
MSSNLSNITSDLLYSVKKKPTTLWYVGFILSIAAFGLGVYFTYTTVYLGIGEWGLDRTVGWGYAIVNFVWWIGIGHAGTFISAILLLFRQRWRNSINRLAETMTIIAILCAAFFPFIHLGRVLHSFYIFPYLNTRNLWVNFNSPLLWDVFAITTYFLVSLIFWYVGMLPDLGLLRDKAKRKIGQKLYGIFSLGWMGSVKQWSRHHKVSLLLAGIATPLVVSVHSIVSMDFATSIVPGWHSTIFPPYFVAGAILSGFAVVLTLVIFARKSLKIEKYITLNHIESMNKIIIVTGSIVAFAYITEMFFGFYADEEYEHFMLINRMTGRYAYAYWMMMAFNFLVPQLFWIKKLRRNLTITFIFSILINVGMWLERFVIVVSSLEKDFITSNWTEYAPTKTDIGLFVGTLGFFFMLFLLFIRFIPIVSVSEIKTKEE